MSDTEDGKRYWVLMGNDYPAGILHGTEEQATTECDRVAAEHRAQVERETGKSVRLQPSKRIYWRVYPFEMKRL